MISLRWLTPFNSLFCDLVHIVFTIRSTWRRQALGLELEVFSQLVMPRRESARVYFMNWRAVSFVRKPTEAEHAWKPQEESKLCSFYVTPINERFCFENVINLVAELTCPASMHDVSAFCPPTAIAPIHWAGLDVLLAHRTAHVVGDLSKLMLNDTFSRSTFRYLIINTHTSCSLNDRYLNNGLILSQIFWQPPFDRTRHSCWRFRQLVILHEAVLNVFQFHALIDHHKHTYTTRSRSLEAVETAQLILCAPPTALQVLCKSFFFCKTQYSITTSCCHTTVP